MAEIYRQQIEHKAEDARMLKAAPFKDYISQGLGNVAEGFQQLDKYYQDRGDKQLAAKMDVAVQEANAMVEHWEDFNTDGRNELMSRVMDLYDQALADSTYDAQGRLNVANPEAKNIFGLKVKEKILEKANEHVYNEKQRDFNAFADIVANIKDPKKNELALRDMIEKVSEDPDHLLTVDQIGVLSDSAARKAVVQTIGLALLDERYGDAAKYITNPFYTKFLEPEDDVRFRQQLKSGLKTQAEAKKAAGGNYEEDAQLWIATRDALYDMYRDVPGAPAFIDEDMNHILSALYSGKSLKKVMVLQWVDGLGVSADAMMKSNGWKAAEYWDSLGQTRRQLIINKYRNIIKDALPDEYLQQQYDVARIFNTHVDSHIFTDKKGDEVLDLSNVSNDELREMKREADELKMAELGLDLNTQKRLRAFYSMYNARKASEAKSASIQFDPIQQNMAGLTAGKTFLGGGNLTESMIRSAQNGEERPSVIDGIQSNMTRLSTTSDLSMNELLKIRTEGGWNQTMGLLSEADIEKINKTPRLNQVGNLLGTGSLSPTMSDVFYIDDGGEANAQALGSGLGKFMQASGEVDEDGDLKVPKPNTYRYMTYVIPYTMGFISVLGNEKDRKNTGIKQNAINEDTVVALKDALQYYYADDLDKEMVVYNPTKGQKRSTKDSPVYAPALPQLMSSDSYQMLQSAFNMGKAMGLIDNSVEPNMDDMVTLGTAFNKLASMSNISTYVPAKDSGAKKRIDYKTKAMQQHEKLTNRG